MMLLQNLHMDRRYCSYISSKKFISLFIYICRVALKYLVKLWESVLLTLRMKKMSFDVDPEMLPALQICTSEKVFNFECGTRKHIPIRRQLTAKTVAVLMFTFYRDHESSLFERCGGTLNNSSDVQI